MPKSRVEMIGVMRDDRGLLELILGDGRGLIPVVGLALALSGGFAILQSASGRGDRGAFRRWVYGFSLFVTRL